MKKSETWWVCCAAILLLVPSHVVQGQQRQQGRPTSEESIVVVNGDQDEEAFCTSDARRTSVDTRGLGAMYCAESRWVSVPLEAAHASAYPVFYSVVPLVWGAAWAQGDGDYTDAYRLTVTQLTTYGTVIALKRIVGRPRPYVTLPLTSRSENYRRGVEDGSRASFPSGHAALSTALATSWSLSHPRWFVVAPSAIWAGAVTTSRLRQGVHYPSDVLTGALLGAGIATGVHLLRDALTPDAFRPDERGQTGPAVTMTFWF